MQGDTVSQGRFVLGYGQQTRDAAREARRHPPQKERKAMGHNPFWRAMNLLNASQLSLRIFGLGITEVEIVDSHLLPELALGGQRVPKKPEDHGITVPHEEAAYRFGGGTQLSKPR
jgi:hypothetical protein